MSPPTNPPPRRRRKNAPSGGPSGPGAASGSDAAAPKRRHVAPERPPSSDEDSSSGGDLGDYKSGVCAVRYCEKPNAKVVQWIQCDKCQKWYHFQCIGLRNKMVRNWWSSKPFLFSAFAAYSRDVVLLTRLLRSFWTRSCIEEIGTGPKLSSLLILVLS